MSAEPNRPLNEHIEGEPQESTITRGASSSTAESDVEMPTIHAGNRPLEPSGDDDIVCGLDVCDEIHAFKVKENHCEGDYADEVDGRTFFESVQYERAER